MIRTLAAALSTTVCLVALTTSAQAQTRTFNIPAGSLKSALDAYARASGRQVIYKSNDVRNARSGGVRGSFSADAALEAILIDTRFSARTDPSGAVAIIRSASSAESEAGSAAAASGSADIVVTGTNIPGAHIASPVISLSRQDMRDRGETNLGDVVREIPQSFAGGQNPNVLRSSGGLQNQNLDSASTINLRGLGPDATLTLLNGHRLSYDGAAQAVDISTIPIAAIERLEVVADGASAIYGSDAVGGVANIILRRDYDGVETDVRLGGAPDGGDFQQQYDVLAGKRWASGGFIATYDFDRATEINAGQRSLTENLNSSTTLLPFQRQHSAVVSGHQSIGSDIELSVDGTFSHHDSSFGLANSLTVPYQVTGQEGSRSTTSFSVAPRLEWHAPRDWLVAASGVYGVATTRFSTSQSSGGSLIFLIPGRYRNTTKIAELSAEGPLFDLPGGPLRLAVGSGHRNVGLSSYALYEDGIPADTEIADNIHASRSSTYGYGEIFAPLVSPQLDIPAVERLEVTAAMRYESYGKLGREATPKLGLIYAPVHDLTLRASWGKSFKTPTLYQQYDGYILNVFSPAQVGASGAPPGSSVLMASGSNPDLRAERATSWTAGVTLKPDWLPGLTLEGSFFKIRYRDRINDVGFHTSGALTNPLYQQLITSLPSQATVDALVAGASPPVENYSGSVFDSSNVLALIDDRYLNASRQNIQGVDISIIYIKSLGNDRRLNLSASSSYLRSKQVLVAGSTSTDLAGTIYNPPEWRARGGGSYTDHGFTASAFVNYVGSVIDNSAQPYQKVRSMTTFDTTLRISSGDRTGLLKGLAMTFAMSNIFNAKPGRIRVSDPTIPAYDSTNYSIVGRLVSVTLSKRW